MMTILLIILIIVLLGGGGGYYAHGRYGAPALAASWVWCCHPDCPLARRRLGHRSRADPLRLDGCSRNRRRVSVRTNLPR